MGGCSMWFNGSFYDDISLRCAAGDPSVPAPCGEHDGAGGEESEPSQGRRRRRGPATRPARTGAAGCSCIARSPHRTRGPCRRRGSSSLGWPKPKIKIKASKSISVRVWEEGGNGEGAPKHEG